MWILRAPDWVLSPFLFPFFSFVLLYFFLFFFCHTSWKYSSNSGEMGSSAGTQASQWKCSLLGSYSNRRVPAMVTSHRCSNSLGSYVLLALVLTVALGVPEGLVTQHLYPLIPIASGLSWALALMRKVASYFELVGICNTSVAFSCTHEYIHTYLHLKVN